MQCKLYWQNQGDYLCVKVDRHSRKARTKKATFCNLELFRMRQKDIPVEVIEHKDYIPTFSWEPSGARFAIVSSNDPNYGQALPGVVVKYNVDFYAIDAKRGDFAVVKHIEGKDANTISWSPKGRHLVLGTLNSTSKCELEFWDLDFVTDDNPRKEGAEPAQYVLESTTVSLTSAGTPVADTSLLPVVLGNRV
jgi:translation initiation factor 3 subunit B